MAEIITCPSGLVGRVRAMKVREERVLADRQLAKAGAQIDELLGACWEETLDPGPYVFDGARVDWRRVLQGDRFFALIRVRAHTYGPDYAFSVQCREAACRARIEWEVDLTQLPVRQLSDESRAAFLGGNRFATVLPDAGKQVFFRLFTGEEERKLPQLQRSSDKFMSGLLAHRVVDVEGIADAKGRRAFLEDISLRDADFLIDEFDRVDCGVDTTIEIECSHCFATQEVDLPFDRQFFLPSRQRIARRKARSESFPS